MDYYETVGSPAKRRKLSGRNKSYSRISVNKQIKSKMHMQKPSMLQYNNKKNIKNDRRVEFAASTPLRQGTSTNMFQENVLSPVKPAQPRLPIIKEKAAIQNPSSKTQINAENFLPIINDNREGIIDNLNIPKLADKLISLETGKGNFTTKTSSTTDVFNTTGASLPYDKDNDSKNKYAARTHTSSIKLLGRLDLNKEASFWINMRKSTTNAPKLYSDKDQVSTEGLVLSRNAEVLSDTVKKNNILLTSNKTDVTVIPKISLVKDKLENQIKSFNKSKIPELLCKKMTNQKKPYPLPKKLLTQDHNLNVPINFVAEKRAVKALSKTDNPVSNVSIPAAKVQKNSQTELQSESNVSKIPQKTKINVSSKPITSKVSFMDPLVSSNGSKLHITREIKLLLDQNKMFDSDIITDLVVEPESSRRSRLRKMRETDESPQINNPKYTKDKKKIKPKKDKQNKILKPTIARNSRAISLKRRILNNIHTSPKLKPVEPIELRNNNQNNDFTKHLTQPIINATVSVNKPNIFMERKGRSTKKKANIAVTNSQEEHACYPEDENIFQSKIVPIEKRIKKLRYTKALTSQTEQLLPEQPEANVNNNNVQNIEKSNSTIHVKHTRSALPLGSNVQSINKKDAARSMLKEPNIKNGVIKMKTRGQSWSPGLKHDILESGINTSVMGVRMMVDIPYNGKTIQLECLADYALICSNYKPIPGTEGNVVYGNGLHTAMNDICSGNIEMNPNSSKGIQTPKRHHLIFCVMTGTVIFTIRRARKKVSTGAHFFVPCGISYNIENIGAEKAVLSFFKITRGCIALDKSA